jgi:hypothetical protein
MPSEAAHRAMALRNQAVLDHLLHKPDDCPEWLAIVAFYKALHLVEALFARNPKIRHTHNHEDRERFLTSERRYANVYKHYHVLYIASRVARYLEAPWGRTFECFADFLTADQVNTDLLNHRLGQIEKSVQKLLGAP